LRALYNCAQVELLTVVDDNNVLIGLFLPMPNGDAVQRLWDADRDWRLPQLWFFESRHIHLKYLRAGRLDLSMALNNLAQAE